MELKDGWSAEKLYSVELGIILDGIESSDMSFLRAVWLSLDNPWWNWKKTTVLS